MKAAWFLRRVRAERWVSKTVGGLKQRVDEAKMAVVDCKCKNHTAKVGYFSFGLGIR